MRTTVAVAAALTAVALAGGCGNDDDAGRGGSGGSVSLGPGGTGAEVGGTAGSAGAGGDAGVGGTGGATGGAAGTGGAPCKPLQCDDPASLTRYCGTTAPADTCGTVTQDCGACEIGACGTPDNPNVCDCEILPSGTASCGGKGDQILVHCTVGSKLKPGCEVMNLAEHTFCCPE